MSLKIVADSTSILRVKCSKCENVTRHKILTQVIEDVSNEDFSRTSYFEVIQCQGCEDVTFRKNYHDSDDYETEEEMPGERIRVAVDHEEFFPPRIAKHKALVEPYLLPRKMRRIYEETFFALGNKQYILAGIGIRAIIELVCKTEKASGRDLKTKIDDLVKTGKLTRENANFLHQTRVIGNKSAHEVEAIDEKPLLACWRISEHLLYTLYILPDMASEGRLPTP